MNLKRNVTRWLIGLVAVAALSGAEVQAAGGVPAIIPRPVDMKVRDGVFTMTPKTPIIARGKAAPEARKLIDMLAPAMGGRLTLVESDPADGAITLSLDATMKDRLGEQGYTLDVSAKAVAMRAAGPAGLFYAAQTLRQLLPADIYSRQPVRKVAWVVPCVQITDYPRFGWRGLLIDPARHFIPVDDVKKYLDAMAMHKFNRLQMHLTDDQGWRIAIRKYPRLTAIGSRGSGYYTQDDIRRLVAYAQQRHITIMPEIEMPGHTGAARDAYPRILGMSASYRGHVLTPRPAAVAFMQDVLAEVMELFPGRYIHIGGDEANINDWKKSEELAEQMRTLHLKDFHELHSWFIKQMDAYLTRHGRRLVGWDEILQGGLAKGATVMSWRGTAGGIAAARAGHDVVMAPTSHTYFDYRQARDEKGFGGRVLPLETVYAFEPVPAELTAEQGRYVLGGQGQLWGEKIADESRREYMTYPRACALIETLWSPRRPARDFNEFRRRLVRHLRRLDAAAINYRHLDPPGKQTWTQ